MLVLGWFRRVNRKTRGGVVATSQPVVGFEELFGKPACGPEIVKGHVVVIGNCLAEGIQMGMTSVAAAARLYNFSVIALHLRSIEDASSKDELSRATHVVAQRIGALDFTRLSQLIPKEAEIFAFQDIVFRSAWPFEGGSGFKDDAMSSNPASCINDPDGALARLRTLEPDKKKRINRYRDLNFDLASVIDRIIETQKRFLASIDVDSDCKLGQYILDNIQDQQLFYSSTHPAGPIFQRYCEFVGDKLNLAGTMPLVEKVDHWRKSSIPVHPAIAQRLGLKWANDFTRYHYGSLGEVTWHEWVEAYIEAFG